MLLALGGSGEAVDEAVPENPGGVLGENGEVDEEIAEDVPERDTLAKEEIVFEVVAAVTVVAEIPHIENKPVDTACFAGPAAGRIVERHRLYGHSQIVNCICGKSLPLGDKPQFE